MTRLEEIKKKKTILKELQKQNEIRQKKLDKEKASLIRQEQNELIEKLRNNKDFILSLLKHDRKSCRDDNNGWNNDTYVCAKCALKEIIDNPYLLPDNVKISFDVHFYHV